VLTHGPDRHRVCYFVPTVGNDCDHDNGSGQTDTDSIADAAQGQKEDSAEDRGFS
jgi:hypothetical protein